MKIFSQSETYIPEELIGINRPLDTDMLTGDIFLWNLEVPQL